MTVAEYLIPHWIDRLRRAEPGLGVSLQIGNSVQVAEMVKHRHVDLGFVEGRSTFPDLESRVVERDDLAVVVAPSHPWARRRRPLSAVTLATTPLVLRELGSGTREVLETALAKLKLTVIPLVELGSTTAIKAAIESGNGAAVLSRLATEGDIDQGRLVMVPIDGIDLRRWIRAVWDHDRQLSMPAKCLLAHIDKRCWRLGLMRRHLVDRSGGRSAALTDGDTTDKSERLSLETWGSDVDERLNAGWEQVVAVAENWNSADVLLPTRSAKSLPPIRRGVRGQFSVPAFGHQKSPPLGVSFSFFEPRFSSPRAPLSSGMTRLR